MSKVFSGMFTTPIPRTCLVGASQRSASVRTIPLSMASAPMKHVMGTKPVCGLPFKDSATASAYRSARAPWVTSANTRPLRCPIHSSRLSPWVERSRTASRCPVTSFGWLNHWARMPRRRPLAASSSVAVGPGGRASRVVSTTS